MSNTHRGRRVRRRLVPISAVALLMVATGAVSSSASATPYTAPLTTSLSIDCDSPPAEEVYWVASTGSLSVSLTDCVLYAVLDQFDNTLDGGAGNPADVTVSATNQLVLSADGGAEIWSGWFNPVYPQVRPSGQMLLAGTMSLPADAAVMNVGPPNRLDLSDDEHFLGGLEDCDLESDSGKGDHVYVTRSVRVSVGGEYTFRGVGTDPMSRYLSSLNPDNSIADPFFALYSSFDPANPDANVVGCNDDVNDTYDDYGDDMALQLDGGVLMEGHQPNFVAQLQPGEYTLVLTLYGELENPTWWTDQAPGSVDFEMWGPVDGLCDVADPACVPAAPVFTG
jgi:hypothetical protein